MTVATFKENTLLHGAGLACTNCFLAIWFGLFAYAHAVSFMEHPRLSILLMVVMETTAAVFLLIRRDPEETWHSWRTWISTTGGTLGPLLLRPTDVADDMLLGQILQISACVMQIGAVLSLNRSFGLLPAYRGVQSNGLYRWVRHPLYSAYTIAIIGYLINNFTAYNLAIVLAGTAFQVMRIHHEERLLLGYPDYAHFAQRTRWRLIPSVW